MGSGKALRSDFLAHLSCLSPQCRSGRREGLRCQERIDTSRSGCLYHLTHRCHDRSFLCRFGVIRDRYRQLLRGAAKRFRVPLLNSWITSNHTHLPAEAPSSTAISGMMQKLEGEFAARVRLPTQEVGAGLWIVQESRSAYTPISGSKIGARSLRARTRQDGNRPIWGVLQPLGEG